MPLAACLFVTFANICMMGERATTVRQVHIAFQESLVEATKVSDVRDATGFHEWLQERVLPLLDSEQVCAHGCNGRARVCVRA